MNDIKYSIRWEQEDDEEEEEEEINIFEFEFELREIATKKKYESIFLFIYPHLLYIYSFLHMQW